MAAAKATYYYMLVVYPNPGCCSGSTGLCKVCKEVCVFVRFGQICKPSVSVFKLFPTSMSKEHCLISIVRDLFIEGFTHAIIVGFLGMHEPLNA